MSNQWLISTVDFGIIPADTIVTLSRRLGTLTSPTKISNNLVFEEIGRWTFESGFPQFKSWWRNLNAKWGTVANWFTWRVTTAMSEGINNVIKALKRRAFGFRNGEYFRLKIHQVCGLLNADWMTESGEWAPKAKAGIAMYKPLGLPLF
jgi:hypothetical protein